MTARDGITPPRATFGSHVLATAGIDAALLRDAARLESIVTEAAQQPARA